MDERAGRYLLRQLLYELRRADIVIPELQDTPAEQIELLDHEGYDVLHLRASSVTFKAHLAWGRAGLPLVERIAPAQASVS
jgi:hypothetical protein